MNSNERRSYQSTGRPGFADAVLTNAHHVIARKLEREVQVRFSSEDCTVNTNEGQVYARAGDAILTGVAGEQWRVSRSHFDSKYRPAPPTQRGRDGTYLSIAVTILALEMQQAFEVELADGRSRLKGRPGDWLVDYGDGSLGIVSPSVFATTYEILR